MTPNLTTTASSLTLQKADRVGVAASILCAIHCALAPILLLALPSFGKVWAHPASHILVALFVVPLALFSIRKGYQTHRKRWIVAVASIGILLILVGALLPALTKEAANNDTTTAVSNSPASTGSEQTDAHCAHTLASTDESDTATGCVDNCCPSLQVDDNGKTSIHIPSAAIVTTLGGFFLIAAHIANLCSCGHACRASKCSTCA